MLAAVIRRLARDGNIVGMALLHTRRGDADELSLLERLDVPRTAVTHTGANTADQLEDRFRKHSLERNTGHDTFRHQFIDIHVALLEIAVG